jgi:hypothetical protein
MIIADKLTNVNLQLTFVHELMRNTAKDRKLSLAVFSRVLPRFPVPFLSSAATVASMNTFTGLFQTNFPKRRGRPSKKHSKEDQRKSRFAFYKLGGAVPLRAKERHDATR